MMNPCRCGSGWLWCWLDWALFCRLALVCDRHDRNMRGENT